MRQRGDGIQTLQQRCGKRQCSLHFLVPLFQRDGVAHSHNRTTSYTGSMGLQYYHTILPPFLGIQPVPECELAACLLPP